MPSWPRERYNLDFSRGFDRVSCNSIVKVVPRKTDPWEQLNGKFSRLNAIKVGRGVDEI